MPSDEDKTQLAASMDSRAAEGRRADGRGAALRGGSLEESLADVSTAVEDKSDEQQSDGQTARPAASEVEALLEATRDAVVGIDVSGVIGSWNRGARELFGYSAEEVVGRDHAMLVPTDRLDECARSVDRLRSGSSIEPYDTERLRKDGTAAGVRLSASAFRGEGDETAGYWFVFRHGASAAAERALRRSEARLTAVTDHVADAIVMVGEMGVIEYANPAIERIFGLTPDSAVGMSINELMPMPHRSEHDGHMLRYLASKLGTEPGSGDDGRIEHPWDLEGQRRDGAIFPMEVEVDELMLDGRRVFVAALRDISERKKWEAELQNSKRMAEAANRSKSEFLANMSHDLRTPLNAIIGFTDLLAGDTADPLADRHRQYVDIVRSSGEHLLDLVNDVLDLSKIEAGKLEFLPEIVDVRVTVRRVLDTLNELAMKKMIEVEVDLDEAPAVAFTDNRRLKQVVYNYASNAIKFNPARGRVWVRLTREGEDWLRIEVEDTGPGISPADRGRLFVEFERLRTPGADREEGTGLGLALVKRIVEGQGGRVGVRSELGKGSTFYAIMPRVLGFTVPSSAPPE